MKHVHSFDYYFQQWFTIWNLSDTAVDFISDNRDDFVDQFVSSVWSGFANDSNITVDDLEVEYFYQDFYAGPGLNTGHYVCDDDDATCTWLLPYELVHIRTLNFVSIRQSLTFHMKYSVNDLGIVLCADPPKYVELGLSQLRAD